MNNSSNDQEYLFQLQPKPGCGSVVDFHNVLGGKTPYEVDMRSLEEVWINFVFPHAVSLLYTEMAEQAIFFW